MINFLQDESFLHDKEGGLSRRGGYVQGSRGWIAFSFRLAIVNFERLRMVCHFITNDITPLRDNSSQSDIFTLKSFIGYFRYGI